MKLKGEITLLVNQDYTTISIKDDTSNQIICEVTLSPEQLSCALSRLANTPCDVEVYPKAFDRLGKTMETDRMEFEIPSTLDGRKDMDALVKLANEATPDGWTSDYYFGSQDSFFKRDGKEYARCIIRRWV